MGFAFCENRILLLFSKSVTTKLSHLFIDHLQVVPEKIRKKADKVKVPQDFLCNEFLREIDDIFRCSKV